MAALKNLSERIEYVGPGLYGPRGWTMRLADGLGISRSQLFEYRRGARPDRDIDGMLIGLIEREREASTDRGVMLTKLRNRMISVIGKQES